MMALYHDAYLFSLDTFANKIAGYVEQLQTGNGYEQLRSDAIRLYEDSANIRNLLGDYGGWDKNAILTQIPETLHHNLEDVAFWLVIVLYGEFRSGLHQLGLGSDLKNIQRILAELSWSVGEIELLVRGKSFEDFPQAWLHGQANISDYWNYIRPSSTSAWAGWLDRTEIESLLSKLDRDERKILELIEKTPEMDSTAITRVYQSARNMLVSAKQNDSDLCIIISG